MALRIVVLAGKIIFPKLPAVKLVFTCSGENPLEFNLFALVKGVKPTFEIKQRDHIFLCFCFNPWFWIQKCTLFGLYFV